MKKLVLLFALAIAQTAMANSELNNADVVASDSVQAPDPSARAVIIHFDRDGKPLSIAHSSKAQVSTKELDKLAFAQAVASAEEPNTLANSTPANELKDTQGAPQWGFAGGGIIRGPNGGFIAGGRVGWGGYGYPRGYYGWGGAGWAGYGWNTGWNSNWNGCGWGGCYANYPIPVYYYSGCNYSPVAFYGGGWGGYGNDFYGIYQPSYY